MSDQPESRSERDARNLLSAVEVMTAVLDGYSDNPEDPDASLATYIAEQLVVQPDAIPEPIFGLLGGLTSLSHLLLAKVEELSNGVRTKEIQLDSYAYAARLDIDGVAPEESD